MARKHKGPGGARPGAGRPPLENPRSVRREIRLLPGEAAAHDAARGDQDWSEWVRSVTALAIAQGWTIPR